MTREFQEFHLGKFFLRFFCVGQGFVIDNIEHTVARTVSFVENGRQNVTQARIYRDSFRKVNTNSDLLNERCNISTNWIYICLILFFLRKRHAC